MNRFSVRKLVIILYALVFILPMAKANEQLFPETEVLLQKTNSEVIEKAKSNVPQRVVVVLDADVELRRATEKHKELVEKNKSERPLAVDMTVAEAQEEAEQDILIAEKKNELRSLKSKIFPSGKLGSTKVVEDFDQSPIVIVEIFTFEDLLRILANSKVQSVASPRAAIPLGTSNLILIGQPRAISLAKTGVNTRIAVIDDGLSNRYSADLNGKIVDAIGWNFYTNAQEPMCAPNSWQCGSPHGQNVTSIVAQVAPGAKISALQGLTADPLSVIRAVNWVLGNYQRAPRIVVVNMSFAFNSANSTSPPVYAKSCQTDSFAPLIRQLLAVNIVPVAGSGNGNDPSKVTSPACIPGVVAVGAVTDSDTLAQNYGYCADGPKSANSIPCFSNGGPLVKILAPGVGIRDSEGNMLYGTSQAAPHVAGAVAVLRGDGGFQTDSVDQTIARLTSSGKPILDGRTNTIFPRLQLDAAVEPLTPGIRPPKCYQNPGMCN